jgi:8-oxo-dGTP pyrophosphatase MutT (NUDIX family)
MTDASLRPAAPSPSATLILARQHDEGIEVYLLRRSVASKFMPGTYVFPGGNMEAEDRDTDFWKNHVDLPVDQLAGFLDGRVETMLPFAVTAIRETWEETGLLLSDPMNGRTGARLNDNSNLPFSRRIQASGLRLAVSRMGRWHHWITPELMPRRFDTFFFVAAVKKDQQCRPDNHETVHGTWVNPEKALTENTQGSLPLSPPTLVTLHQMLPFADLDELMAETRARPWPAAIMPRLWPLADSALIVEPWDPDYACKTVSVDVDRLETDVLPVGMPFSRLWQHRGRCRPVRVSGKSEGI